MSIEEKCPFCGRLMYKGRRGNTRSCISCNNEVCVFCREKRICPNCMELFPEEKLIDLDKKINYLNGIIIILVFIATYIMVYTILKRELDRFMILILSAAVLLVTYLIYLGGASLLKNWIKKQIETNLNYKINQLEKDD